MLLALSAASYAVLVFVAEPSAQALANGGKIPDLWLTAYGAEDMRALLEGAEPGLAEAYARVAHGWDLLFPVLFGVTCALGFWQAGGRWRWAISVALAMTLADLNENRLAVAILSGGVEALDPMQVAWASATTRVKFLLYAASVLLLIASFIWTAKGRGKP